jgi:hypothetical protein
MSLDKSIGSQFKKIEFYFSDTRLLTKRLVLLLARSPLDSVVICVNEIKSTET